MLSSGFEHLWPRLWGVGIIIVAAVWAWRRHVDVGIEGEPPSFTLKGRAAIVAATLAAALGFFVLLWPEVFS